MEPLKGILWGFLDVKTKEMWACWSLKPSTGSQQGWLPTSHARCSTAFSPEDAINEYKRFVEHSLWRVRLGRRWNINEFQEYSALFFSIFFWGKIIEKWKCQLIWTVASAIGYKVPFKSIFNGGKKLLLKHFTLLLSWIQYPH